jgi:hypothetical protein
MSQAKVLPQWAPRVKKSKIKQLSGAEPVLDLFKTFVDQYPKTQISQENMHLIDRLLHSFHWIVKYGPTRPVAINLIEGRLGDVILFLDELSSGPSSTPGTLERKAEWTENSRNARGWVLK